MRPFFDLRLAVGLSGFVLSVVIHELFHIFVHWGEIQGISIFPGTGAIVEIVLSSSSSYNLIFEEAMAYTVSIVTLVLTAMLICDIHDMRDKTTIGQTITTKLSVGVYPESEEYLARVHIAEILGVELGLSPTAGCDVKD